MIQCLKGSALYKDENGLTLICLYEISFFDLDINSEDNKDEWKWEDDYLRNVFKNHL